MQVPYGDRMEIGLILDLDGKIYIMKVFVKAKPNSKQEKVEIEQPQQSLWQSGEKDLHLKVWVKERPVEGRANEAIRKALARYLNISNSQITLISGSSSKNKVFEVK